MFLINNFVDISLIDQCDCSCLCRIRFSNLTICCGRNPWRVERIGAACIKILPRELLNKSVVFWSQKYFAKGLCVSNKKVDCPRIVWNIKARKFYNDSSFFLWNKQTQKRGYQNQLSSTSDSFVILRWEDKICCRCYAGTNFTLDPNAIILMTSMHLTFNQV